jgi:hypothetical protein
MLPEGANALLTRVILQEGLQAETRVAEVLQGEEPETEVS